MSDRCNFPIEPSGDNNKNSLRDSQEPETAVEPTEDNHSPNAPSFIPRARARAKAQPRDASPTAATPPSPAPTPKVVTLTSSSSPHKQEPKATTNQVKVEATPTGTTPTAPSPSSKQGGANQEGATPTKPKPLSKWENRDAEEDTPPPSPEGIPPRDSLYLMPKVLASKSLPITPDTAALQVATPAISKSSSDAPEVQPIRATPTTKHQLSPTKEEPSPPATPPLPSMPKKIPGAVTSVTPPALISELKAITQQRSKRSEVKDPPSPGPTTTGTTTTTTSAATTPPSPTKRPGPPPVLPKPKSPSSKVGPSTSSSSTPTPKTTPPAVAAKPQGHVVHSSSHPTTATSHTSARHGRENGVSRIPLSAVQVLPMNAPQPIPVDVYGDGEMLVNAHQWHHSIDSLGMAGMLGTRPATTAAGGVANGVGPAEHQRDTYPVSFDEVSVSLLSVLDL